MRNNNNSNNITWIPTRLEKSGYNYQLKYETANSQTRPKRPRRRNITWYNPPFSKNVATNVGRKFKNIVNKCFLSGHFKNKLLMHAKFRKENRCTQQEYATRETTTTRKDVQMQIETWLPAKRRMLNYQCHLSSDSGNQRHKRNLHRPYGRSLQNTIQKPHMFIPW